MAKSIDEIAKHAGDQNEPQQRTAEVIAKEYLLGKEYEASKKKWGDFSRASIPSAQNGHLVKAKGRTAEILAKQIETGACTPPTKSSQGQSYSKAKDALRKAMSDGNADSFLFSQLQILRGLFRLWG